MDLGPWILDSQRGHYSATNLRIWKMITVMRATRGTVINQALIIFLMTFKLRAAMPLARPTPITDPTRVWLVDTGRPSLEQTRTVVAVANSAEKPLEGVMKVILMMTVIFLSLVASKR